MKTQKFNWTDSKQMYNQYKEVRGTLSFVCKQLVISGSFDALVAAACGLQDVVNLDAIATKDRVKAVLELVKSSAKASAKGNYNVHNVFLNLRKALNK